MFRIIIILVILFLIDFYIFQGIRHLIRNSNTNTVKTVVFVYWLITIASFIVILAGSLTEWSEWPKALRTYLFAFVFVTYFSKIFMLFFMVIDDLYRGLQWVFSKFSPSTDPIPPGQSEISTSHSSKITRSDFLLKIGSFIAAIPFAALIMGMIKGKYEYQVKKYQFSSSRIPKSFDGFKIIQISDLHVGSFNSSEPLRHAVQMINKLNPDVILFTGDLVNNTHDELFPYVDVLAELKASEGIFSILGNHDYGDYHRWKSPQDKKENLSRLISEQRGIKWDLLLDEHRVIARGDDSINIAGVQNWSGRANFARYGDLDKAMDGINNSKYTILMSHDPSHWREQVLEKHQHIDLTLSGHTHGFQFGIEIPGFKWSPVQYVYKEWAGIYSQNNQHLYVNRGLGFLGYPGRVGILPEITYIELKTSNAEDFIAVG
jgi:uncharacterized protein